MQSQIPFFWLHRMDMEWNVQNVVENILMSILMSALLLKATFHFQRTTPVTFTLEKATLCKQKFKLFSHIPYFDSWSWPGEYFTIECILHMCCSIPGLPIYHFGFILPIHFRIHSEGSVLLCFLFHFLISLFILFLMKGKKNLILSHSCCNVCCQKQDWNALPPPDFYHNLPHGKLLLLHLSLNIA